MKNSARVLGIGGFAFAVWLFVLEDPAAVARLLAAAGFGLVLAALCHIIPMALNARAWQLLMSADNRPTLVTITVAVWVRESVNGLLPVARIGGEIVSYRVLVGAGVPPSVSAAGLVVDMTLSVLSQMVFSIAGVLLLVRSETNASLAWMIVLGLVALALLVAMFIIVQRGGLFAKIARVLGRGTLSARFATFVAHSEEADRVVREIYTRSGAVVGCLLWQFAGWIAGSLSVWAAAFFLNRPISALDAIAIEAVIQAVSSVAFVVPAALGLQEGAFVVAGAAIGLDAPAALALAAARRARDVVVFFPGLASWPLLESERRTGRHASR